MCCIVVVTTRNSPRLHGLLAIHISKDSKQESKQLSSAFLLSPACDLRVHPVCTPSAPRLPPPLFSHFFPTASHFFAFAPSYLSLSLPNFA